MAWGGKLNFGESRIVLVKHMSSVGALTNDSQGAGRGEGRGRRNRQHESRRKIILLAFPGSTHTLTPSCCTFLFVAMRCSAGGFVPVRCGIQWRGLSMPGRRSATWLHTVRRPHLWFDTKISPTRGAERAQDEVARSIRVVFEEQNGRPKPLFLHKLRGARWTDAPS